MANDRVSRLAAAAILTGVALLLAACATTSQNRQTKDHILLTQSDGNQLEVPLTGPLYNEAYAAAAMELNNLEDQIESIKSDRSLDPEVRDIMVELASSSRDEAIDKLCLSYKVAQKSSGLLDRKLLQSVQDYLSEGKSVVSVASPRKFVRTEISSSVENAVLHYMSIKAFASDADNPLSWQSYKEGDILKIGRYVFRVHAQSREVAPIYETVQVLNDPTERVIHGR